jgi:hypothetical protein
VRDQQRADHAPVTDLLTPALRGMVAEARIIHVGSGSESEVEGTAEEQGEWGGGAVFAIGPERFVSDLQMIAENGA